VTQLQGELERSNQWAEALNREVEKTRARILELQAELSREQESARGVAEGYRAKVAELEAELARRAAWAKGLEEQLANYRSSAWVKLGRKIRMGPAI
jgi:predicted  nucleic acid-binding Zn-ribbon protein